MALYDVTMSLLVDGTSREDAMEKVREYVSDKYETLEFNWMVHDAEIDTFHLSLADLRKSIISRKKK